MSYRSARACPECATLLSELALDVAIVDHCGECGGLWIDWFDGEISSVAAGAQKLAAPMSPARAVAGGCPDCRASLSAVRYPDERSGPEIFRCGSCAGAFVPRRSLALVIALGAPPETPSEPSSRLQTLWAELRRILRL